MSRRSPLLGFGLAWGCLLCLLALLLPVAARAEGKPNLGLSVTAPKSILFGAKATVTLEASNPAGEPYGYNLSYRAVLPEGVAYVPGSAKLGSGGAAPTPTVIENQPKAKETTVIWSNVGDLSPASHSTLSFEVTPSQATYPVASEFTVPAEAFVAEAPRYLPKFKANGEPKGPESTSYTGYAKGSTKTAISALEIKQEEGSPEGEILRGVHDHQTVYKVTVTNNSVNATTGVNVDDWLPASLEYLGCGGAGADHTTDAPTNPPSKEEYPGSGPIDVAALGGCTAPALVETKETDPDGAGVDPTAVYTHLRWTVAELKPGESRTFEFRAAVPLRENTTSWTGAEPTPASGHQAANLDNNSGKETKDGESIVTFAKAEGLYKGTTAVSAEEHLTRVAKDLTTEKSANLTTLSDGQVSKWTILVHSSEYRYNTKVEVTDTLPNGLCPLSSTNLSNPVSAECEPNGDLPSSPYASTKEEENGTWKLVWNETTDPALATLKQNETTTITFYSTTRTHYQSKHAQAGPILSNDSVENMVLAEATTNVVCDNDTDCSEVGAKPIDHERPLNEPVQDNSHFTQSAVGPTIKKEVAASGTNCLGDTYTGTTPVYHPGDLICWRLQASFPATLSTHGTQVTDFLPELVLFDEAFNGGKGEAPTSEDTLPATTFDHSEAPGTGPGGALKWTLPESGIVGNGSQRFERVFATDATLTKGTPLGDLQGNLMKFASINSKGESFALRAEADFELQFPQLTLGKQIVAVGGKAITPASTATVKQGEEVAFALTLSNAGKLEAERAEVRENLATGLTCAEVVSKSNLGVCSEETVEGKAQSHITWGGSMSSENIKVPAATEPTLGTLKPGEAKLEFTVLLPSALDPGDVLKDEAGVAEYKSPTNNGGTFTYIPKENIEPLVHPESEANSEKAIGEAELKTEEAKLKKTHTTSVVEEPTNTSEQATIGETVTYSVTATVPAGTTLNGVARLTDPGFESAREEYETGSVEALVNGTPAPTGPGGFSTEVVGGKPVVVFPADYGPSASAATLVTMRFKARVLNVEANYAGGTATQKSIPNSGELSWTSAAGVNEKLSASNPTPLVEPLITLTQTPATGTKVHGGQVVEYSLKLKNAAGASTAFGNEIVDTIPSGLTPTNSSGVALKNGESTASGGVWNEGAHTITWTLEKLEGGKEQPYAFFAKVNESPVSSTNLENVAVATTGSIKEGAEEKGRTANNTKEPAFKEAAIKKRYESKTEAKLEVEGGTIAKVGTPEKATIGEKITYTLTVTVPQHTMAFNETVIDTLPSTLEFVKYSSATCVSGCGAGTEIEPKPYTPENNTTTHTNRVAWYLGNVGSASETRVLKLVYVGLVRAKARGTEAEVKAGNTLENSAMLYYNTTDSGYVFKEATVPPATFNRPVGPAKAKTTVIEPSVAIVKEAKVNGGEFSTGTPFKVTDGDTITYRLKVTNSGTAPAYNVSVTDALPASGLTEVKTVENAPISSKEAEVTKETSSELAWTIPALGTTATPVKTITLEYTAKLAAVTTLKQGQEIANTAKVPTYFGVPAAERTGKSYFPPNEAIEYRSYKGNEATLKAKVALPAITIEKTTGATGFPTSANAEVGQPFTWRVVVKNISAVPAKNLKITDKLPANWEYAGGASFVPGASVAPTEAGTLEGGRELTWSTSIELPAGESTVLTYQAKPTLAAESNPGSGVTHPNKNTASATVLDAQGNPEDAEGPFAAGPATAQGVLLVPVLTVSKTPVKASVAAGAEDEYKIVIQNTGAGVAREVLAEDTLPTGMTYKAGSATASPATGFSEKSASATKVVWAIESIAPGASVEIKVPVGTEASLEEGKKLENTVAVHATAAPTPVKAEGTITLTTSADLVASKKASPESMTAGTEVTYTIAVLNKGPSVAKAVKLVDPLPAKTKFVSADVGCSDVAGTVECAVGELAPNASASYHVTVLVESSVTTPIVNTVEATSSTHDPELANNKASKTVDVTPEADLQLVKKALEAEVNDGQQAAFELTATNKGPSDASEAKVVDTLPAGLSYVSANGAACTASGQEVTCLLGTLASGAHVSFELITKAEAVGVLLNLAAISSPTPDPEPLNNESSAEVTVAPAADLSLEKTVAPETVEVPGEVTYTLTATNHGPDTAQEAKITDVLPTGESWVSGDPGCSASGQTVTCTLGEVVSGASAVVHFKALVSVSLAEQKVVNHASVSSQTFDPEPANNEAHAEVSTLPSADLELVKTALTPEVHPGQQATFSLVTTNKGPSDAAEAKLVDTLPAGLAYVSASGASCEAAGQTVTCTLGTLTAGSSVTVELTTQPAGLGSYINTAAVTSTTPDPNPTNNSSAATVKVVPVPPVPIVTPPAAPSPASGVSPSTGTVAHTRVTLRKLVREHEVAPGGRLDYRLIVRDAGARTAEKLQVCDTLPPQTTVISRGGGHLADGRICFTLATLAVGRSHTFTLVLRADSDARGQIVNHASVTGKDFDSVNARASTPVQKASVAPVRESHVTG